MATYTVTVEGLEIDEHVYEAECEVEAYSDSNYGADADGNRGGYMEFIERVEILSCAKDDISIDLKDLPDKVRDKIEEVAGDMERPDDVEL